MQLAQRKTLAGSQSRARCVRVAAVQSKSSGTAWAASIAAAALIAASPATAGVVLEQPQLKKVFQADGTTERAAPASAIGAKPGQKKAAKAAAPAKKKQEAVASSSGGIAPQAVALPAALLFVGGGAFALSSVDAGFAEFMRTAAVKDSSEDGAGYEEAIKSGAAGGKRKAGGTGTTKAKAKKGGTTSTNPLGSLFGGDN